MKAEFKDVKTVDLVKAAVLSEDSDGGIVTPLAEELAARADTGDKIAAVYSSIKFSNAFISRIK